MTPDHRLQGVELLEDYRVARKEAEAARQVVLRSFIKALAGEGAGPTALQLREAAQKERAYAAVLATIDALAARL